MITQTPRLNLRHFTTADADAMDSIFSDPEVMHFGSGVQSSEWVRTWLHRRAEIHEQRGYCLYAVILKETGHDQPIGYCGLTHFPDINGQPEIEIGFRLARAHWGKGYATEAALAVRDYAFQSLGLHRLIALIDPANTASIRVAQKLGMTYEKDVMLDGYDHPDRVYVVERSLEG